MSKLTLLFLSLVVGSWFDRRCYSRHCDCSSKYGLCKNRWTASSVWLVHGVCWFVRLLPVCYLQRYQYRPYRYYRLLYTPHMASNKHLKFNLAVMSLLVGQTVTRVVSADPSITGPEIAVALSLFTGQWKAHANTNVWLLTCFVILQVSLPCLLVSCG